MNIGRKIDHIVYAVSNLEEAMQQFEQLTGIAPIFGGYHTTQGTKNALVNLGNSCYLELLAVDKDNTAITPPRWMGIDLITTSQVTRWSLKTTNSNKDSKIVKEYDASMGKIQGGQRKMTNGELLVWDMVMPLATPAIELIPFMTDWQQSTTHPTLQLPQQGALVDLQLIHPMPSRLQPILDKLEVKLTVVRGRESAIRVAIQCPAGRITI